MIKVRSPINRRATLIVNKAETPIPTTQKTDPLVELQRNYNEIKFLIQNFYIEQSVFKNEKESHIPKIEKYSPVVLLEIMTKKALKNIEQKEAKPFLTNKIQDSPIKNENQITDFDIKYSQLCDKENTLLQKLENMRHARENDKKQFEKIIKSELEECEELKQKCETKEKLMLYKSRGNKIDELYEMKQEYDNLNLEIKEMKEYLEKYEQHKKLFIEKQKEREKVKSSYKYKRFSTTISDSPSKAELIKIPDTPINRLRRIISLIVTENNEYLN